MQKYTVLSDDAAAVAAAEVPLINGHDTQLTEQAMTDNDYQTNESISKDTPTLQHYTNKANIAKLQWWNTPTPRLTLDPFNQKATTPNGNGINSSASPKHQEDGEDVFQKSFEMQNQNTTPQQRSARSGDNSPLSKSASSSRHRLNHHVASGHHPHHHHSSSSVDNASPRIRLTNQFSIEEEPDPNKQDSQLLLNGK